MDVKQAVDAAKKYVAELFSNEGVVNLGLEEVEFDDQTGMWNVTVGFSRPWDKPYGGIASIGQIVSMPRTYKVVKVQDVSGRVVSVKGRETKG
ncbi:MAG TPA: hypothetical protein VGM22_01175 [Methylomirabilota bacterium]|jgi:hypothetical protein